MTATAQPATSTAGLGAHTGDLSTHTLAGEHAALMRDVERRARPVMALLDSRAWPHAELGTLIAFLRTSVLRQASDEEVLFYPHDSTAAPFAELSADHVRLHELVVHLGRVRTEPCHPQELRSLLDELLATLRRHLHDEQAVFAALLEVGTDLPSAAALAAGEQTWPYPNSGPVLILLDELPEDQAIQLSVERILRLRPGQHAQIHTEDRSKLTRICRWLHAFDPLRYGAAQIAARRRYALEVTRRDAG